MAAPKKTVKPVAKAAEMTTAPKVEVKKPVVPVAVPKAEEKKEAPKAEEKKEAAPKAATVKKEAAPKAAAKKAAAPKAAAKKEAAPKAAAAKKAAPKAAPKAAAKKAPAKKAAKKEEMKSVMYIQFSGKSYSQEDFVKMAKDVWKYDLKQKVRDLNSIELYVKPEESKVYYVMNQEFNGSFDI